MKTLARLRMLLLGLLLATATQPLAAQSDAPFVDNIEIDLQRATFDAIRGLALRANHAWKHWEKASLQTGLQVTGLFRRTEDAPSRGEIRDLDMSVGSFLFTGFTWKFGKNARWRSHAETYLGLRTYIVSGTNTQSSQGFERQFSRATPRFDAGIRSGIGYRFHPRWTVQTGLTVSLMDVNNPLGLGAGLLYASPDVLTLVGLGVVWELARREE